VRLADILDPDDVTVNLSATGKRAALRAVAELFARRDDRLSEEEVLRVFEEREALASTGVGSGVAIPHGRLDEVERLRAVVAISGSGIEFDAIDGRPVRILVGLLGRRTGEHLMALRRFARLLRDDDVRRQLLEATDAPSVHEIVLREDEA